LSQDKRLYINNTNKFGLTPLMISCKYGFIDIVQMLLEKDANVNILDIDKTSALMYASLNKQSKMVKLLIDAHADVNAETNSGKTAFITHRRRK